MKLKDLAAKKEEYLKAMKEDGSKILKELFTKFFKDNPYIEAVRWTQYTPYFNDGDTCTFGYHGIDFIKLTEKLPAKLVDGEDAPWYSESDEEEEQAGWVYFNYWSRSKTEKPLILERVSKAVKDLEAQFSGHDELFQMSFGDHCKVIATKDSFEVEDYEHD